MKWSAPSGYVKYWRTAENYYDNPERTPNYEATKTSSQLAGIGAFLDAVIFEGTDLTAEEWRTIYTIVNSAISDLEDARAWLMHTPLVATSHTRATNNRLKAVEAALENIAYAIDDLEDAINHQKKMETRNDYLESNLD